MGKAGAQAHQEIAKGAGESGLKHSELRQIVKGLRMEFPELYHIAHMALHPLTLVVAGITAAFALWNYRMKELTALFGNVELPDITPTKVGHVNAAAEAWKNYGEQIRKAAEAYESVDAAADRHAKKMTEETERQKKLLDANKGLELAQLEGAKGSMSEGEYESKRLQIENRYAAAGLKIDESSQKNALNEKARRGANLQLDAQLKAAAAGRIKVGSAEDDNQTEEDLKRRAEAARKEIDERNKMIDELDAYQSGQMGPWDSSVFSAKYTAAYGLLSPEAARAEEIQKIGTQQVNIDRYYDFLKKRRGRDEQRARRSELYGEAAKEMSEAGQISSELPGDVASTNADIGTNREVGRINTLTRTV
ncbi:MAG TPA: hypothetical protein VKY92_07530, partial [Verrucomicrobiae bacterium]|nr:hypothetical protein [Verrucomicrobiae bacterium]